MRIRRIKWREFMTEADMNILEVWLEKYYGVTDYEFVSNKEIVYLY